MSIRSFLTQFVVCLLVTTGALACSDRNDPLPPVDTGDATEVTISDFQFSAPTITIARGETVRWRNTTGNFHTVTPDGHQIFAEQQTSTRGQTFEVRFDTPGRYRYFCNPHRALGMTGEVVVN
jgi:plastocyanin